MRKDTKKQLIRLCKVISLRLAIIPFWPMATVGWLVAVLCIVIGLLMAEPLYAQQPNLHLKEKYKVTTGKAIGWATIAVASAVDGALEGYQFDGRKSFERKWGVDPYGPMGSQSWRMVYVEGNPELGFKSWFHEKWGALDFYHLADDTRKFGYIGGGISLGIGGAKANQNWKHWLLDIAITSVISSGAKSAGMRWVRK